MSEPPTNTPTVTQTEADLVRQVDAATLDFKTKRKSTRQGQPVVYKIPDGMDPVLHFDLSLDYLSVEEYLAREYPGAISRTQAYVRADIEAAVADKRPPVEAEKTTSQTKTSSSITSKRQPQKDDEEASWNSEDDNAPAEAQKGPTTRRGPVSSNKRQKPSYQQTKIGNC
jgi:hypothetical protein